MNEDLRYPIGKYEPQPYSDRLKAEWIGDIRNLPALLEQTIQNLDEAQLQTPYREGGWTVHQVVHHVADSHMNAYIRFKLALTEDIPVIKPYDEAAWALLSDVRNLPVNISLTLLHALHKRWHEILINTKDPEWSRAVFHPEQKRQLTIWEMLGSYAWHGRHHVAHVNSLRERMGW